MINITVKEIAQATGGRVYSRKENETVNGFSIDSRTTVPGDIFIAIKGSNFDGHDFIGEALDKGASGIIVQEKAGISLPSNASHLIAVEDTLEALGRVAAEIRSRVDIPVVCITGTNGKTTVKDILSRLLSAEYKVLKSDKSYNNIIGLSLTLFDLDSSYDVVVLELGTNHPGEIPVLARIAAPHIAIITNIGDGHLQYFVDREGVFVEKISLLDYLPDTGMAFLNRDDPLLARAATRGVTRKFYGSSEGSDFLISDFSRKNDGYEFSLNGDVFFVPLKGEHNIYNAASAVAVAGYFGISVDNIRQLLKEISLPGMRLEKVTAENITFINDSYNANPDSFECALMVLKENDEGRKKGVVAGDMMELGEKSDEFHEMIGKSIQDKGFDFLITLGKSAGHIADGALEEGMSKDRVLRVETHEEAAVMIKQMADKDAVVLLKGSRASRMEEVLKCFTISCTH
ncbi:MAG: UDP-N-acetylmuramoyl-tripeptide--D-alanyl-D-alanine ligase [Candidatus Omnitrophota bacterium]